jgi:ATP-binding cassette subfamily B protein
MYGNLKRLWANLSIRRRTQFFLLFIIMLLSSIAEISTIGLVIPFLGVLISPEIVFDNVYVNQILIFLNLNDQDNFLKYITVAFVFTVILAGAIRLVLIWFSTKLSYSVGNELSTRIFTYSIYQPYIEHCKNNSSEIVAAITSKTNTTISLINMLLTLLSSAILVVFITASLFYMDSKLAFSVLTGFGVSYLAILAITKPILSKNSAVQSAEVNKSIAIMQESFGGIREVIIDNLRPRYCKLFQESDLALRKAQGSNMFLQSSPRFGIEAIATAFLALLAYYIADSRGGLTEVLPVLGAFALAAQRILPMVQHIYSSFSAVLGSLASLTDALTLLERRPFALNSNRQFNPMVTFDSIKLRGVCFGYSSVNKHILHNLTMNIPCGSMIGIIGETGAGKSTLLDIIMGLIEPLHGVITIGQEPLTKSNIGNWHASISHVPQQIHLSDTTIAENIACSDPYGKIDYQRLAEVIERAQLADFICALPDGYHTIVGENGARLSGGQKQRIGIARALYKRSNVLILDEATSALDSKTENAVFNALKSSSKALTIIMVTHRSHLLNSCSMVFKVVDGRCERLDKN